MTRDELAALDTAAREWPWVYDRLAYTLVNAYRSGQLVMVPSVEEVAKAIQDADDAAEDWLEPEELARAVLASMGAKADG